jgi:galactokinase
MRRAGFVAKIAPRNDWTAAIQSPYVANIDTLRRESKQAVFFCISRQFFLVLLNLPRYSMQTPRQSIEETAIRHFRLEFGQEPAFVASAPGRVNLIGEHTDYNEGFVFPAAIDKATAIAAGLRPDNMMAIYTANLQARHQASLEDLSPGTDAPWANYSKGVAVLLRERGCALSGMNLSVFSSVPRGGGLSSSAALEVATAGAIMALSSFSLPDLEVIKICQRAEHEAVGVKCGIMDQFISRLGRKSHAMFLDCRSLTYRYFPLPPHVSLLVCDTGVRRALATSEYNKRRNECSTAVSILSGVLPGISSLRDVSWDQFLEHQEMLDPLVRRRAKHVISENRRVEQAAEALEHAELSRFGKLMYDSHLSLQHDYEVSCQELDAMVDICAEEEGVYGARMTGAGFGGSAICLVDEKHAARVQKRILHEYPEHAGRTPVLTVCTVDDGAHVRRL